MARTLFLICIFTFSIVINTIAQDCTVEMQSIKGKYEGDCKNGKAEGKGKATGTDVYEGEFKDGLPNGTGKYTWKNGSYYDGKWSHGKRDGAGVMVFKLSTGDSLVNGNWKKDVYAGKFDKPYILYSKTRHVTHFSCRRENNLLNQVDIFLSSESGGNPTGMSMLKVDKTPQPEGEETPILPLVPKPQITNITITKGNFESKIENENYGKKIVYTLQQVTFPFRTQINMGNDFVDIEFLEAGKWVVEITLAY